MNPDALRHLAEVVVSLKRVVQGLGALTDGCPLPRESRCALAKAFEECKQALWDLNDALHDQARLVDLLSEPDDAGGGDGCQ